MIVETLAEELKALKCVEAAILFGSYARGDMNEKSDIDLCIIAKDKKAEKIISEKILDLGKQLNKTIQVVFTDPNFINQDQNFIENVLREGRLIVGRTPTISLKRLQLEPYIIIKYDLRGLKQAEKMKVNRILYGKKTSKKYKNKTYISQKEGLVVKTKSEKIGRASILTPQDRVSLLEKILREHKIPYRKIPTWLPKI